MTAPSRERIALVVFVILVFVGIGSLVAYINIGHSWNVTASQIDDATGELEGYTAILYAGTVLPETLENAEGETSGQGTSATSILKKETDVEAEASDESGLPEDAETDAQAQEGAEAPVEGSGAAATEEGEGAEVVDEQSSESTLSGGDEVESVERNVSGGAAPLFNSNSASTADETEKDPVTVEEAAASYREKQANVFVLDVNDLSRYEEGLILKRGDRRFGVFSVTFNEPAPSVKAKVDYLTESKVDFIVALTPDKRFVQKVEGIDIVISLQDEGFFFMGETVDGTFYVDAPLVGQVGAILVSPHNVVSAKDIEEL